MSGYRNTTLFQATLEPFEEGPATGRPSNFNQHGRSTDALDTLMEEKAVVSRRLSRKDSKNGTGRSLWRRKSTKKFADATATQLVHSTSIQSSPSMDDNDAQSQENLNPSLVDLSRSIIPDPLGELPAWFKKESEMAAANISTFRIKYPLHSPKGPRWYKNHHLLPPVNLNRPPSLFSPSFPPMAASVHSIQDRSEDSTRLAGPSRSPSSTPLPTPSSSQVRIPDPSAKPRSRKTSQDNVDLMDVSDPWGTRWHHESPYDAGNGVSPASTDPPEGVTRTRSRLSSMNAGQTRRKTVTPSPLSQSTSALHLQTPEPQPPHVTRKLSKRRKPILAGLFGTHEKDTPEGQETTTVADSSSSVKRLSTVPNGALFGSRRHSTLSPAALSANGSTAALSQSSSKHDKRQSVLGRLVRKFSLLGRHSQDPVTTINDWPVGNSGGVALSAVDEQSSHRSFISQRQPSPDKPAAEKKAPGPSKRIPPPRIDLAVEPQAGKGPSIDVERVQSDRTSTISYDVPLSPLGKLMIANPDAPSSGGNTPVKVNDPLPPETSELPPTEDVSAARRFQLMDWQQAGKLVSVPSSAGRSSPIPGLLSPISVAVPAVSLPEVLQFTATAHSPIPPLSSPHSSSSAGFRPSTSATAQVSTPAHTIGDVSSGGSSPPAKEASNLLPPRLALPVVDDSPLSKASVLVNPPTPYDNDEPHPELPVFERVLMDRSGDNRQYPDVSFPKQVSPTKEADAQLADGEVRLTKSNSTSRKTETYKLVRTPSEKVSSPDAFQAEGNQWLVVNSAEAPRRRKTKERTAKADRVEKPSSRTFREREHEGGREKERSRDRERDRDRERERERERERDRDKERVKDEEREHRRRRERATQQGEEDQRRTVSHAKVKSSPVEKADSGSLSGRPGRARSLDNTQRSTLVQPLIFTLQDQPSRPRKSDDRPRDSVHQNHSKSARPGPNPIVTVARVDRLPSMSARPTSELTSAADLAALKAREAWEMDRLWKGRSMVQGRSENVIPSPSSTESKAINNEAAKDALALQSFAHGSSHTSYVVQPLQAHPIPASVFYANMPSAPPPIIYAATPPYGQPHSSSSRDYTTYRSLPNSFSFPSKDSSVDLPMRVNPLPAPPRESSYQPTHLPVLADRSSGSASEYWGKYAHMPHS